MGVDRGYPLDRVPPNPELASTVETSGKGGGLIVDCRGNGFYKKKKYNTVGFFPKRTDDSAEKNTGKSTRFTVETTPYILYCTKSSWNGMSRSSQRCNANGHSFVLY